MRRSTARSQASCDRASTPGALERGQDPARRRRDLRARQPVATRPLVRLLAGDRADGRATSRNGRREIEAVDAEAVIAAARRWLDHKPAVTGYLRRSRARPHRRREVRRRADKAPSRKKHRGNAHAETHRRSRRPYRRQCRDGRRPRAASRCGWSDPTRCRSSSLEFAMRGGAAQDPADKAGLGTLVAGLLDEGAGDLDAQGFHRALDEKAIEISFHHDRDHMSGRMRTLAKNLDRAAELLRACPQCAALRRGAVRSRPRAYERAPAPRRQRSGFGRRRAWRARAFAGHPYGQPADGSLETLLAIERADLDRLPPSA